MSVYIPQRLTELVRSRAKGTTALCAQGDPQGPRGGSLGLAAHSRGEEEFHNRNVGSRGSKTSPAELPLCAKHR